MNIMHHFGLKIRSDDDARAFSDAGIQLSGFNGREPTIVGLDVGEDDPQWDTVRELARKFKITDFVYTRFSELELTSANVLCALASTHSGFPSSGDYLKFLEETYDLTNYCLVCGVGLEQVRPLRIKFKAHLKRAIWQLNWVFDEFLVAADVWAKTFEPLGIECWPVLSERNGKELKSIVQLRISHQAKLASEPAEAISCPSCGRKKTPLTLRGFASAPINIPAPLFKSTDHFGSGASACRRIFVSGSLYLEIRKQKLRGIDFYPCELPDFNG